MESKYLFRLAPAYCLYNGVAVIEQNGAFIKFMIENPKDKILKGRLTRAFCNYLNYVLRQKDCEEKYRRIPDLQFVHGNREELRKLISKLYGIQTDSEVKIQREKQLLDQESEKRKKEAAAVLLLDGILIEAKEKNATDIHIEHNLIKLRINGLLENYMSVSDERKVELIQRIKLLAGMNALEKRKSQDGHFVYGDEKPMFIRVSSVAIINERYDNDESVVLRVLNTSRTPLSINFLGFNQLQIEKINELCQIKNGLILVCGPTCSGKSTTVASILTEIEKRNFGKLKIISLEDPPEYIIPGVCQLKIDEENNNSFGESLDYLFRQNPDVIMIGEIRNEISAKTAIRAALTGHLVFATIHTGSAGEAVLRLENLGLRRKIITSVLKCVIVQNLSYMEAKPSLYADVAITNSDFSWLVNENMSSDEIEEYYNHFTNYMDVLSENIKHIGKIKRRNLNKWGGEKYVESIHEHIG